MSYDPANIFAKILRGEIPADKVYEDEFVLAFRDIKAQARHHVLLIPKGAYVSFADFSDRAGDREITAFIRAVGAVARQLGIQESGYRLISNAGPDSHQEVPHFHVHLVGGEPLGRMLLPREERG
ncbi:MAG TPA: HIT domain-containing protein [Dongiaceae bacterium]|jgi:diadenosine tetraphosphate (Ap4A) HIT family hydrolase|nr:HIT domain-containing protein [Dongiaceae bacterium]